MRSNGMLLILLAILMVFAMGCGDDDDSTTTDGDVTDGDATDGDATDGDTTDGDTTDGDGRLSCSGDTEKSCVDSETDLVWQNPQPQQTFTWAEALAYCENLEWGGESDWRLPSINELRSLISGCPETETGGDCKVTNTCSAAESCNGPGDACAGCEDLDFCYWPEGMLGACDQNVQSSTTVFDVEGEAWFVGFYVGAIDTQTKTDKLYARCVRGGGDITDGDVTDGDVTDGDTTDGDTTDGDVTDGDATDGDVTDGDVTDGDVTDGDSRMDCTGSDTEGACTDTETTLVWQNPIPQQRFDWDAANAYCDNLDWAGITDWRLPTINELRSLITGCEGTVTGGACAVADDCASNSCLTPEAACNGCADGDFCYWPDGLLGACNENFQSATTVFDMQTEAWFVGFYTAAINTEPKVNELYLRCVSGDTTADGDVTDGDVTDGDVTDGDVTDGDVTDGDVRFECTGEVSLEACTDTETGLVWQNPAPAAEKSFAAAGLECANLDLAGHSDWRLPSIDELRTLVVGCPTTMQGGACHVQSGCLQDIPACNENCNTLVCDAGGDACFTDDRLTGPCNNNQWSSDSVAGFDEEAWYLGFYNATISTEPKDSLLLYRCVRGTL